MRFICVTFWSLHNRIWFFRFGITCDYLTSFLKLIAEGLTNSTLITLSLLFNIKWLALLSYRVDSHCFCIIRTTLSKRAVCNVNGWKIRHTVMNVQRLLYLLNLCTTICYVVIVLNLVKFFIDKIDQLRFELQVHTINFILKSLKQFIV